MAEHGNDQMMLELASQGARGVQIRAIEYAKKHNVTIHVRSGSGTADGTLVTSEDTTMEGVLVTGIVYDKNEAKIAVSPGVGFGDYGDDHVRIALIENEHRLRQAVRGIKAMFRKDGLI